MALNIQRLNMDPVTGDNPSEAFMKLDLDIGEIAAAIDGDGTPGTGLDGRLAAVETTVDGLGNAATKDIGTAAGTVAAGDDVRFERVGRNLLMNADGRINERAFAGGAIAANTYSFDRWRTFSAASSLAIASDRSTITLNGTVGQVIETPDLANATITVSVSNPTGPITVKVQPDATTATTSTGTITAGSGIRSVTLTVPATLTGHAFVLLSMSGAVTIDWSAKRGGIQVELGSVATLFDRRSIGEELIRCQRYFERIQGPTLMAAAFSATDMFSGVAFKVVKRSAPSVAVASNGTYVGNNGTGNLTTAVTSLISVNGFSIDYTAFTGSITPGFAYGIRGYDFRADSDF
jgi:hypothetical protein